MWVFSFFFSNVDKQYYQLDFYLYVFLNVSAWQLQRVSTLRFYKNHCLFIVLHSNLWVYQREICLLSLMRLMTIPQVSISMSSHAWWLNIYIVVFKVCFFISTVLDDEDTSITAGSIVTVEVSLKRQMMEVLFDKEDLSHVDEDQDNMAIGNEDNESNKDQVKIEGGSMISVIRTTWSLQMRITKLTKTR